MSSSGRAPRPQVILVDGEPAVGYTLPRHVVPPPLVARRVLVSDLASLRSALESPTVAAIIDGRTQPECLDAWVSTVRGCAGGAALPILVLVRGSARDCSVAGQPMVEIIAAPASTPAMHARLMLLTGRRDLRVSSIPPARTG